MDEKEVKLDKPMHPALVGLVERWAREHIGQAYPKEHLYMIEREDPRYPWKGRKTYYSQEEVDAIVAKDRAQRPHSDTDQNSLQAQCKALEAEMKKAQGEVWQMRQDVITEKNNLASRIRTARKEERERCLKAIEAIAATFERCGDCYEANGAREAAKAIKELSL